MTNPFEFYVQPSGFFTNFVKNGKLLSFLCLLLIPATHIEQPVLAANSLATLSTNPILLTGGGQSTGSRYDFGSLSGSQPYLLSHVFVLQNYTPHSQTIIELRPACGCTSALLGGETNVPFTLPPGRQISVCMTLDPVNLPPGPVSKAVWVYVRGQEAPAATLEMTGTLLPAAQLSLAALNFGRLSSGDSLTLPLTVTWNSHILPAGTQCRLVSTNPEVQITPEPPGAGEAQPLGMAVPTSASADIAKAQSQTYRCTLSPQVHLGELWGDVQAVVTVPRTTPVVVGSIPIQGNIAGDVTASPAVVAFGTVPHGQTASRQIALTLAQPILPTVTSASPYLTARLYSPTAARRSHPFGGGAPAKASQPDDMAIGSSEALLTVTLNSRAPAGPLEADLTVTTRSGQRLWVPVYVLILSAEAKP